MIKKINYYLWASYRRKLLDKLLKQHEYLYKGTVLDIGGRSRGKFNKPKNKVEKWIIADINKENNPDLVLDIMNMKEIESGSIDVINATELFEHVNDPEKGLRECLRVLKKEGLMIISCPFLFPIHADPYDYQRWTKKKWQTILKKIGFQIEKFIIMGRFFTVHADNIRNLILSLPRILRLSKYLVFPITNLLIKLDQSNLVLKNEKLNKYHGGYFIIIRK